MSHARPIFVYFTYFFKPLHRKTVDICEIRTWIVGEGENNDYHHDPSYLAFCFIAICKHEAENPALLIISTLSHLF